MIWFVAAFCMAAAMPLIFVGILLTIWAAGAAKAFASASAPMAGADGRRDRDRRRAPPASRKDAHDALLPLS